MTETVSDSRRTVVENTTGALLTSANKAPIKRSTLCLLLFLDAQRRRCLRGQRQRHGGLPLGAGGLGDVPQGRGPLAEEEAQQLHGDRPGLAGKIREWQNRQRDKKHQRLAVFEDLLSGRH